jgi:electron transfer flavoprotein alpha subunit
MTILLIAEHDNETLSDQTAKALTAAVEIGGDVHVLVAGKDAKVRRRRGCEARRRRQGAARRRRLARPAARRADGGADRVAGRRLRHAVAPATANGKNTMPRVAALLDVMQISDIIAVESADTFKRPIYAGNAIQTVQSTDAKKVITVRTASFAAAGEGGSARRDRRGGGDPGLSSFVSTELAGRRPSGADVERQDHHLRRPGARFLREKFEEVILPVADKLGAAVGASRAAVDAGYAPNDWQVGQTGKVVAPGSLHRLRHLGCDPASRRHEGLQGHRRHQQGRGSADLPGRRLRPRRRPLRCAAGARKGDLVIEAASEKEEVKREIFSQALPGPEAGSHAGLQHLVDLDHPPCRVDRPAGALHGHPLHESGAAHEAGRTGARHRHRGRHLRGVEGICPLARQDDRPCRRISPPSSSTASCCR